MSTWAFSVKFKDGSYASSNGLSDKQVIEEVCEFINDNEVTTKDNHLAIKIEVERD